MVSLAHISSRILLRGVPKNYFLISQPKHMLWVLKRTVSMIISMYRWKKHGILIITYPMGQGLIFLCGLLEFINATAYLYLKSILLRANCYYFLWKLLMQLFLSLAAV